MRGAAGLARAAAVAGLTLAAMTAGLASAWADPVDPLIPLPVPAGPPAPPPADPAPAPAAPQTLLGQFAQATQINPITAMNDLLANSPQPAAVGMAPPPPGTPASAPGQDPWTMAQLLRPQNYRMPTDDQASPYALAPNDNPSPFARIDAWKGVHALAHSNLGRMPGDELGQALPGTAPPPGTNLPAGLEQFYTDPAAVPPPADPAAPPADPLLIPLAPPN